LNAITNILVDVGLSIGDDEELMFLESIVNEFLKRVLVPHERSPFAEDGLGEKKTGEVPPTGR
jgi:hypothetical protein